jgi:hypothetical protein
MSSTPSVTNTPDDLIAGRKYTFHHDAGHGWLELNLPTDESGGFPPRLRGDASA